MSQAFGELEQRLRALKLRMESGLGERARSLRELASRLEAGDASARKAIKTESHKLRGVAGTYGHQTLTDRAAVLEQRASLSPPAAVGQMARELADLAEATGHNAQTDVPGAPRVELAAPSLRPVVPVEVNAPEVRPLRVLAMDDDPLTLRLLTLTLQQVGRFDATIVDRASTALELLAKQSFDVVISDAMMPDMNGRELCQRARELGHTMPVVILSAASPEELGWTHVGSATAWLRKPFKPTELVKDIQRIAREHAKG